MNVRQLIEQLQQFDPEMMVVAASDPEQNRDYPVVRCEISPWTAGDESGTDVYLKVGYQREECYPAAVTVDQI